MDAHDIFRKLTVGVKFNTKRFHNDAQKFQMVRCKPVVESIKIDDGVNIVDSLDTPSSKLSAKKAKKKSKEKLALLHKEQITHFRRTNRIHVIGTDVADPMSTFEDLRKKYNLNELLLNNIQQSGYLTPTPVQMQAIPIMLEKRELLACAPTGSGKTASFLLPMFHELQEHRKTGFRAVIVSPTRELAKQTLRECERLSQGLGIKAHYISKVRVVDGVVKPIPQKKYDILITTPNRLIYLLQQETPAISLKSVQWLIIDEADKLFEAGPTGFRDQLAVIYTACDSSQIRRAMFSATFTHDVEQWCQLNLDNVLIMSIGARNAATELVEQQLLFVGSEMGKLMAFRNIVRKGIEPPVLVFVQTKDRARELFNELIYDGINVDVIHADRTQLQRDNTVKSFRSGKIWILICTELMGRGIDFKGINVVVNYDFPSSAISYVHRIGRTGRAGRPGKAITFFTEDDVVNLRRIAQVLRDSGCEVPSYMLKLKKPTRQDRRYSENHPVERGNIYNRRQGPVKKRPRSDSSKDVKKTDVEMPVAKKLKKNNKPVNDVKRKANNTQKIGQSKLPKKKKST